MTKRRFALGASILVVACGTSVGPSSTPAPPAPSAPAASVAHDARLVVLGADGNLRVVDAYDLAAPPSRSVAVPDREVIFDVRADGAVLLGDDPVEDEQVVMLVSTNGGLRVVPGDGEWALFEEDGAIATSASDAHPPCSGIFPTTSTLLHPASGGAPREIPGRRIGLAEDGHTWVMEVVLSSPCAPGERPHRTYRRQYVRFDPRTGETTPPDDDTVTLALAAGPRIVGRITRTSWSIEPSCTLRLAGAETLLASDDCAPAVSPDGRFVAANLRVEWRPEMRVFRAADGQQIANHACKAVLDTDRFIRPRMDACFSHDGERLVVVDADGQMTLIDDAGGSRRALGEGACTGFSADDRFLLSIRASESVVVRVIDLTTGESRVVPDAQSARFVPPRPD